MNGTSTTRPLREIVEAVTDLFEQQMRTSLDLLESLGSGRTPGMARMLEGLLPRLRRAEGCGCAIPPPCWAPLPAGEVTCHVCPGGTGTVRIHITNCGAATRHFKIEVGGQGAGVAVSPAALTLGPMERGYVAATASVPADASTGETREILVWVRGCRDHFLRWIVTVATRGADCCHEVEVEDCPEFVHHWYDHFYCEHPCPERG